MRFEAKRHWPTIFTLVAAATVIVSVTAKRRNAVALWSEGKIEVARGCSVFTPGIFDHEDRFEQARASIREVQREGAVAMYDTPIGSFWYPVHWWTLPVMVEMEEADGYGLRSSIRSGDVVVDVGAGVGVETAAALSAGAATVVAIEPDPLSLECLRRNLAAEIREKRVLVVPKGAWNQEQALPLYLDILNGGGSNFSWKVSGQSVQASVSTIDHILAELNVSQVSFIKVHVEGAERQALEGASETIRRYHPRLALSLEHHVQDVENLPVIARGIWPGYHVQLTPCTKTFNHIQPGVALLSP